MIEITLQGRKEIFIPKQEITEESLPKIIGRAMAVHMENANEIDYLWNFYKGKHPILKRVKKVRPEINSKLVINHAYEFMNFYQGYVFGEPIQYIKRGKNKGGKNKGGKNKGGKNKGGKHKDGEGFSNINNVAMLNGLMKDDEKESKDSELGEWALACGVGYRMTLPSPEEDKIFDTEILDPRVTFIVKDTGFGKKPWMCVTFNTKRAKNGYEYKAMYGYTENLFFYCDGYSRDYKNIKIQPHVLCSLPIVEYPLNNVRIGVFEPVIHIIDALDIIGSNRQDSIEQRVQSFIKFVNCDIDPNDFDELREKGLIKIKVADGNKADVDYVTVDLDQTDQQTYVDSLYQSMLQIVGVPDRNASAGGNTGQALYLGQGWSNAETRAKSIEAKFKQSEKKFLRLVLRIIKDTKSADEDLKNLVITDIDVKFTRNKTDSLLVKAQALLSLLEAGVHPRIAFELCGLFSDPEQSYTESQPYLDAKWLRDLKTSIDEKKIESEEDALPKLPITG